MTPLTTLPPFSSPRHRNFFKIHYYSKWDSGVDKTSRRAAATDLGSKTDTWIMAPADSPPNQVEIQANAPFHLDLGCEVGVIVPAFLQTSKATISFSAIPDATTNEILESHAPIKLGIPGSDPKVEITTCVKVKTVKRRTIIVNVYPITSAATPQGNLTSSPSPNILQQEMQDYFDRVWGV